MTNMLSIKNHKIEFFGCEDSLAKWKGIVESVGGQTEPIKQAARFSFVCVITSEARKELGDVWWYKESGTGKLANGSPYHWNHCITFSELPLDNPVKTG